MKRKSVALLAAITFVVSMLVVPGLSFGAGKNPPTSCGVGFAVSAFATQIGGLGKVFQPLGFNPGQVIQDFHNTFVKPACQS